MKHKSIVAGMAIVGAALSIVGTGSATAPSQKYRLQASLTAKQVVPPQSVKAPGASGRFSGTLVVADRSDTLTWQLTASRLSSPVKAAYVLFPASGKLGQVSIGLCSAGHCGTMSKSQTSTLTPEVGRAITGRTGYVTIVTAKNPQGEVRGKLVATP
jgi:hypothetical protein